MGVLRGLLDHFQDELERHRTRPFMRATMAACAMVATVDGGVSFGERVRVDQIMETLDALKIFDPHEGIDEFNKFADHILREPHEGHDAALQALHEGADTPEKAKLLIRICLAIAEADGIQSLADQIEIVQLCSRLGVDPGEFDLYPAHPKTLLDS